MDFTRSRVCGPRGRPLPETLTSKKLSSTLYQETHRFVSLESKIGSLGDFLGERVTVSVHKILHKQYHDMTKFGLRDWKPLQCTAVLMLLPTSGEMQPVFKREACPSYGENCISHIMLPEVFEEYVGELDSNKCIAVCEK